MTLPPASRKAAVKRAGAPKKMAIVRGSSGMGKQPRWTPSDDAVAAGFDPFAWLGSWLTSPNPALGGQRPLALLDTSDGRLLVDGVLATMESGVYV